MRKMMLTASLALVALGAAASGAAAYDATISPGGGISAGSVGALTFDSGGIEIDCNVTLDGDVVTFVEDVETLSGQYLEAVDDISWGECTWGEVRSVLGLPWDITYGGYTGTLPAEVSSVSFTLNNVRFILSVFGGFINCLYAGDVPAVMATPTTETPNEYTTGSITTEAPMTRVSGAFCPARGSLTGTFSVSPTQTITIE